MQVVDAVGAASDESLPPSGSKLKISDHPDLATAQG